MPKTLPDYSKSCIYKLVHREDFNNDYIYIGSSTNFIQRKCQHKLTCNNPNSKKHNVKVYQFIRDNGGWDNWIMVQIEPFSCNSKKELETRERYWIETLKSKLNKKIPTRTKKERLLDDPEKMDKERLRSYNKYHNNKEKECNRKKIFYSKNKEKYADRYNKKKDEIQQHRNEKIICECGCVVNRGNIAIHKKTKKHQELMKYLD